jgi:hypothetical protein
MTTTRLTLLPTRVSRLLLETAFAAVLVVSLVGCGGSPAGTYEIDKTAMRAKAEAEIAANPNPQMAEMAREMIDPMLDSLHATLTLSDDGGASMDLSMMGQSRKMVGTWSASGDTVTLNWDGGNSGTAVIDGGNLRVRSPSGEELILNRR